MRPAARLAAAIDVLERWAVDPTSAGQGLEATLRAWARANRYAGSGDRSAIADHVHDALRRRTRRLGLLGHPAGAAGEGRALILAGLIEEGETTGTIAGLFSGDRHAPPPLTGAEAKKIDALASPEALGIPLAALPEADQVSWPAWAWPLLAESVPDPAAEAGALMARAAFDLRVNRLKATPAEAAERLAADGLETAPAPLSPDGLRAARTEKLARLSARTDGLVEPQDAASQAVARLAASALAASDGALSGPVLDYCAGGGGKTLALLAETRPEGLLPGRALVAHDIAPARLSDLAPRLARAGAPAVPTVSDPAALDAAVGGGGAALTLVDAPCSGSGAWARKPEAKWRLTPERLAALGRAQREALAAGASQTAVGGVLIYATCSLFAVENEAVAEAFSAANAGFAPIDPGALWARAGLLGAPPAPTGRPGLRLSPHRHGAEGFYLAAWRRDH